VTGTPCDISKMNPSDFPLSWRHVSMVATNAAGTALFHILVGLVASLPVARDHTVSYTGARCLNTKRT
jgi:hypothetical protein